VSTTGRIRDIGDIWRQFFNSAATSRAAFLERLGLGNTLQIASSSRNLVVARVTLWIAFICSLR